MSRIAQQPSRSFPEVAESDSELEAFYRFFSNENLSPQRLLRPHVEAAVKRACATDLPLVVHDTTYFEFDGEREGMGRLHQKDRGFWAHFALAVGLQQEVHGVVGLRYGTRHGESKWSGAKRKAPSTAPSEQERWLDLAKDVVGQFGAGAVVHVMDREGDWYPLLHQLAEGGEHFVVRLNHDRHVETEGRISDALAGATTIVTREVELSARARGDKSRDRRRHPERAGRTARLEVRGIGVVVEPPRTTNLSSLSLNVVQVVEVDAPAGATPVEWKLVTTEPIDDVEDVLRVVDIYRMRWLIEEYFKALKTGCAFEKRQLGSYRALLNCLGALVPVAWYLLRLRAVSRTTPDAPATTVLSTTLLAVLSAVARRALPNNPTARDVTYAVAGLGGHLKRNGDPGWMTLGRGFERLLEAARVVGLWKRSDQS